jgi:hypothetical protein
MKAWKEARRFTASDRQVNLGSEEQPFDTTSSRAPSLGAPTKLTQFPTTEDLSGSTPFRLSCSEAPRGSVSEQTKYHLASLGGGVAYRSLLKRAVNEIDTTMEKAFALPTGNEQTKKIETPIPPPPPRNLIVIDVHVTIPPEEPQPQSSRLERRASRLQSNAASSLQKFQTKTVASKLAVDTHQVLLYHHDLAQPLSGGRDLLDSLRQGSVLS